MGHLSRLLIGVLLFMVACKGEPEYEIHERTWNEEEGFRWAELPAKVSGADGFIELAPSLTGVDFINSLTDDQIAWNRNLLNGSGVAAGDVTGNGFPDLYFTRLDGPNLLYENRGGFRFEDITERAGLALPDQFSTGALFADLNGNGRLDLVVTSIDGPNRLFFNRGEGLFDEMEGGLPADRNSGSKSIAAGDLTGNGALDLYIVNYKYRSVRDIYPGEEEFRHIVRQTREGFELQPKFEEHYKLDQRDNFLLWFETGEPDLLYFNDGAGNFERVDLTSGIFLDEEGEPVADELLDWGLHVRIADINQNGLQDIYVANDFESPDRIWLNRGDGTFQALPRLAMRKSSLSSMAVDFSDINRNGFTDFIVVEMLSRDHSLRHKQMSTMAPSPQPIGVLDNRPQYLGNTLFLNRGDETWAEISEYSGVRRSDWSWSVLFMDVTLDGYEDLLITNGHYLDVQDSDANARIRSMINAGRIDMSRQMLEYPRLNNRNAAFRNNGDLTFTDLSSEWGFEEEDVSHGIALADLNLNGYLDMVVSRLGSSPSLYKNRSGKPRLMVRLRGEAPNREGIGSRIIVRGGPVEQEKPVLSGGGYLSGSEQLYLFAAGEADGELTIEIHWPDGGVSRVEGARPDRIYEIDQSSARYDWAEEGGRVRPASDTGAGGTSETGAAEASGADAEGASGTKFTDGTDLLNHRHDQDLFDDFDRQPLLPKRLSQQGPGVLFIDLDGDGFDELIVTDGKEGELSILKNDAGLRFAELNIEEVTDAKGLEQSSVVGWRGEHGETHLVIGYSNYHGQGGDVPAAEYYLIRNNSAELVQTFAGFGSTPGSMSLGDFSGNGYPDLFIAGSVRPGRYPESAGSRFYINNGETFEIDEASRAVLNDVGLIQGALFSDITGDGRPELILAPHWGTLRIFRSGDGHSPVEITSELGLGQYKGWWNGVATGDLTGNGRLDIVATNWGENHMYANSDDGAAHLFYRDFVQNGYLDLIEAYYSEEIGDLVPRRGLQMLAQFPPFVGNRVGSFREYSESSLESILGMPPENLGHVEANHFSHRVFIQDEEGRFRSKPLPRKAQLAPAFSAIIADFTGDGHEDLFLSQNFFAYQEETPRSDAGRGLLLKGDGEGNFEAVNGRDSGILVYGEQRGAAAADINRNGKLDLVVSQNAAATRLFLNERAEPGLKVLLNGPAGNRSAVGAKLTLLFEDGQRGAVREVQAGSGYRSQNSFTQIMGGHRHAGALEVIWPDGSETVYQLEPGMESVLIDYESE